MPTILSDDLRQALSEQGAPLRLVDPATGEFYVLVPAADFDERTEKVGALADDAKKITNSRLLELATRHAPPAAWLEGDEEELF